MIPEFSNLTGSAAPDLIRGVIEPVLQIVHIAARRIVDEQLVDATFSENQISRQLCEKMREEKTRQNRRLQILEEVGTFHTTAGRIDFMIIYDLEGDSYFGIECKRLSGKRRGRLDREYVTQGMMRFVTGKYSRRHPWGMMFGYVISGPRSSAIQFVRERVDEYRTRLRIEKEFAAETQFSDYPFLHSSSHRQEITNTLITLLHYAFEI